MSGFLRSDRSPLAAPVAATIYEGRVARTHKVGDALMYASGPEHRDVDEVQNIVAQLAGVKVYLGHPATFPAETSGQKVIGYIESGRMDDDSAVARIVITDDAALAAIKSDVTELSLGYVCTLSEDRFQKSIKIDHLAIVERARCGAQCALRADENQVNVKVDLTEQFQAALELVVAAVKADSECPCKNHTIAHTNGDTMSEPKDLATEMATLNEKLVEANKALTALEIEATNARKDADATKAKLYSATAELAQAKLDADAAVSKAKTDAEAAIATEIQVRVDARVALLVEAKPFLAETDLSKMSDRDIKCMVIKHVDGDEVAAEKSMDYVTGVYEGALKRAKTSNASRDGVRAAIVEMRKDGVAPTGVEAERAAKANMNRESAQAWTK